MFQELGSHQDNDGDKDNHNRGIIRRGNHISMGGLQRKCEYQIDNEDRGRPCKSLMQELMTSGK
jgi:hypothetical protein